MTLVFMGITAMRAEFLWPNRFGRTAATGIWYRAVVLLLSAIGNLTSTITAEKLIFTPVSIVLVAMSVRL